VWVALDRSLFTGDESQYARAAVELIRPLRASPREWLHLMVAISPSKPSALVWLGQFFVPVGSWLGSIDRALVLCSWRVALLTLALLSASL
jgi:hypothetical protein